MAFKKLQSTVTTSVTPSGNGEFISEYSTIFSQNSDMVAWLSIPNTTVSYPIMFTPNDSEYYLRRSFDKKYSESGTPFIGSGNIDNPLFIIYGHNMKDSRMFGALEEYKNQEFFNNHNTITLDTPKEKQKYSIISIFESRVLYKDEIGFRYYDYYGNLSREQFDDFIQNIDKISMYKNLDGINYGDKLMMLSTCSYHTENGRLVVVAKKIS
ncbi:MAG: class B sortase [Filifactoraceae bacterium]